MFGGQSMGIERRFGMFDQFLDLFEFQLVFQKNGSLMLEFYLDDGQLFDQCPLLIEQAVSIEFVLPPLLKFDDPCLQFSASLAPLGDRFAQGVDSLSKHLDFSLGALDRRNGLIPLPSADLEQTGMWVFTGHRFELG